MNLLLIRPNDQKAVYGDTANFVACEPPYWAAVIGGYVRQHGLDVGILDAEALNASPQEIAEKVCELEPDLIGVIVTGTNLSASTQKMHGAGLLCRTIKSVCNQPIFLWGLHPSALPERTLREEAIDYVIKGEGLNSILELTQCVSSASCQGSSQKNKIYGLFYWKDGMIQSNPEISLIDSSTFPSPAWDLLPMECYLPHNWHLFGEDTQHAQGRYAVIATSLGCPFNCTFCAISTLFGSKKVRFLDIDYVINEIDLLVHKYNIKYIKILDECFVLNKAYVSQLCDKLIERNYDLSIWGYARIDTVDAQLLHKLRQAGVTWLAYGIESGSAKSLDGVAKGQYDNSQVKRIVEMNKQAGINVLANFMFGLPDDDLESMQATYELSREINPEWINYYVTMSYPGSQLYDQKNDAAIEPLSTNWLTFSQYSYECIPEATKFLTPKEVLAFRDWAFNAFFTDNPAYFQNIEQRFGVSTVLAIQNLIKSTLKRKLLEQ